MKNCMYCEEKKCVCKNIQKINKLNYFKWVNWIKELIYKSDSIKNF
jgi:hypothetical protein